MQGLINSDEMAERPAPKHKGFRTCPQWMPGRSEELATKRSNDCESPLRRVNADSQGDSPKETPWCWGASRGQRQQRRDAVARIIEGRISGREKAVYSRGLLSTGASYAAYEIGTSDRLSRSSQMSPRVIATFGVSVRCAGRALVGALRHSR